MQAASPGETVQPAIAERAARRHEPLAPTAWASRQQEWVTAVLVVHNGMRWLPQALDALAAQRRGLDRVIAVDTGSTDGSDQLLLASPVVESIITLPPTATFGRAVAAAVESVPARVAPASDDGSEGPAATEWLWLVHDDSAPEPDALSMLLAAAQHSDAAVLGPKVRGWHDTGLLVECGLSITDSGRRFTGIEVGERDQGQRDDVSDVLAVGSAGMLVRRDLWQRLDGFDDAIAMYGDDIDFCIRARRADERVLVVPEAVIHHREAARHGVRPQPAITDDQQLVERKAALYTILVHGPALLLPLTSLVLLARSLASALVMLLSDGPRRAMQELRVWGGVHLHPIRVLRARRRLRSLARVPRRDLRDLRPGRMEQWAALYDQSSRGSFASSRPGRSGPPIAIARALLVTLILGAVALLATRSTWAANGPLAGGALLPVPGGDDLWQAFRASWHDVGLGSAEPAAAYPLALIVAAAPPLVTAQDVVQATLLLAVPLAGLGAFLALRGLPNRTLRGVLAVAYGLTPAAVVPSLDGRLGTAVVAILLPWFVRLVARILVGHELTDSLPPPRVRTVAGAALLLAIMAAFAPLMWVAAACAVVIAALWRDGDARMWVWSLVLLVLPLLVLWPWSWALLTDPSRVMFEAGVSSPQLVADTPPSWRLLLLDPGTLDGNVLPAAVGLAAAAICGLLLPRSRSLAVWGWLLIAVGLFGATVQTSLKFLPLGGTTEQHGFAGPMLLLMAAGMVIAAASLVRADGQRSRAGEQSLVVVATVGLLAGPVYLGWLWVSDLSGPLGRSDDSIVPAFVVEEAVSPAAVRTLLLETDDQGAVGYSIVNGAGARLGDADVAPPAQTWRELSGAVAGLTAGVGPQPAAVLARNAVRYIVADSADATISAALDANSSLRRLSTTNGRGLWLVDGLTSRARLVGPGGESEIPLLPPDAWYAGTLLASTVEPGGEPGRLVLAQVDDGDWSATVAGQPVVTGEGLQLSFEVPAGGPVAVAIGRDQSPRDIQLLIPLAALLILGLLMLPRGHLAPPPDLDNADGDAAPVPAGTSLDGGRPE